MPALADLQRDFADALLDVERLPDGVARHTGVPATRRFDVYRNNRLAALKASLAGLYPVVEALAGDDFFTQLVRDFARVHPPTDGRLLDYGGDLGDFLGSYPPAAGHPYLADMARLEALRWEAYIAPEAVPFDPATLAALDAEAVAAHSFDAHPSVRLFSSDYPVDRLWRATKATLAGEDAERVDMASGGVDIIILRPYGEVAMERLSSGEALFLRQLLKGAGVADAAHGAAAEDPEFDLADALAGQFARGTFAAA